MEAQREGIISRSTREGWMLVEIIEDPAKHGSTEPSKRPGLARCLKMLRDGEADVLVAHKIDRACRSTFDLLALSEQASAEGWALAFNGFDFDPETPIGKLVLTMLGAIAEFERALISERTREGLAQSKKTLGKPPVVPERVAERIRAARARGQTWQAIADALNSDGVPTGHGGAMWRPSSTRSVALRKRPSPEGS
jgi:DNA invertase Pin-like site-specific DNA recombinase